MVKKTKLAKSDWLILQSEPSVCFYTAVSTFRENSWSLFCGA